MLLPEWHILSSIVLLLMPFRSAGVAVLAAGAPTPLGPDYFHSDLGTAASLQCPGVQSLPTQVTSVSWFRGNSSTAAVQPDDRVSVDSAGRLAVQDTKASDGGWYFCEYASGSGLVTGSVHLNVVGAHLDLYIVDPATGRTTPNLQAQNTVVSLPPNMVVVFDAGTSQGDDIRVRDPYFLHKGENVNLRRPYFCYGGYILSQNTYSLRLVMLTSSHNYSGHYEFVAGGLRASINLTIRDNGKPTRFPAQQLEEALNLGCNDNFSLRLVTLPVVAATTTSTTTPPMRTPTGGVAFGRGAGTSVATETATTAPMAMQNTAKTSTSLIITISCAAGSLLVVLIVILLLLHRTSRKGSDKDNEKGQKAAVPKLASELPPRTLPNNLEDVKQGMFAHPKPLQAMFPLSRSNNTARCSGGSGDGFRSPTVYGYEYGCEYEHSDAMTYRTVSSTVGHSVGSLSCRHSRDSLLTGEPCGAHTPSSSSAFRAYSQATMLSAVPGSEAYDSRSLHDYFVTSGGGDSAPQMHGTRSTELLKACLERTPSGRLVAPVLFVDAEQAAPSSCPPQRRNVSGGAPLPTVYRLVERSGVGGGSPTSPPHRYLDASDDCLPRVVSSSTPVVAALVARCPNCSHSRSGSTMTPSPLLLSETASAVVGCAAADLDDEFRGHCRSSANVVVVADDEAVRVNRVPSSTARDATTSPSCSTEGLV